MIYVMSGMQGSFKLYNAMINEKLELKDDDSLFILGNIIGACAEESMSLLCDMMYRPNIYPVLGKNEYFAKKLFPQIADVGSMSGIASVIAERKALYESWIKSGGLSILEQFMALSDEKKESITAYLDEFTPYEELDVNTRSFVLVHSGIDGFEAEKELDSYSEEAFVLHRVDYGKIYYKDKFLITSDVPTSSIPGAKPGKVFTAKRHLAINPGPSAVAAVCLDTMKVYYSRA